MSTAITRFFGDGPHLFQLTGPMCAELEKKTGAGIGELHSRIANRLFRHADLFEIVRCALIGGGTSPAEADHLVKVYAEGRPLAEPLSLALAIMLATFHGAEAVDAPDDTVSPAEDRGEEVAPHVYSMPGGGLQLDLDEMPA